MKKPKNMRLVNEVVEILKKEGIEPTHANVSNWIMSQIYSGTHHAAKYGRLKQGDFAAFFSEYNGNKS